MRTSMSTTLTFKTKVLILVAVKNDCYSEAMAYMVLTYSYLVGFHDAYIDAYTTPTININHSYHIKAIYRIYLANHMESISCHITPLVINSLWGRHTCTRKHTHTQAYRHSRTEAILRNQVCTSHRPAHAWINTEFIECSSPAKIAIHTI